MDKCPHGNDIHPSAPACNGCETWPPEVGRKAQRIAFLERKRLVTIEDLKVKLEAEDWHGCQDCGSDLRDIDNEIFGLRF